MNSRIILAVATIAVLTSCSTAYKAQTPDDVYYSPERPQAEYVNVETQKDRDAYRYEEENADDRYLRWKVRNRTRWSSFDDYAYDWYDYRYNNSWYRPAYWNNNLYWTNYWAWNYAYNPYCGNVVVINPKNTPAYNQVVRTYKPGTYKTTYNNNNYNSKYRTNSSGQYRPAGSYNNSNNSFGNSIKKVFNNSNSNNSSSGSSDSRPTRTYSPPSNSGSSSGSSSSGSSSGSNSGGGVSRPSRGGR